MVWLNLGYQPLKISTAQLQASFSPTHPTPNQHWTCNRQSFPGKDFMQCGISDDIHATLLSLIRLASYLRAPALHCLHSHSQTQNHDRNQGIRYLRPSSSMPCFLSSAWAGDCRPSRSTNSSGEHFFSRYPSARVCLLASYLWTSSLRCWYWTMWLVAYQKELEWS